jgi:hypothetical protein
MCRLGGGSGTNRDILLILRSPHPSPPPTWIPRNHHHPSSSNRCNAVPFTPYKSTIKSSPARCYQGLRCGEYLEASLVTSSVGHVCIQASVTLTSVPAGAQCAVGSRITVAFAASNTAVSFSATDLKIEQYGFKDIAFSTW